jgi:outer membrane protein insertion porin family
MRRRRALCLAFGWLTGCAHTPPHRPGEEQLKAIQFEGNKQISDSKLGTGLALRRVEKRGGAPDPYLVQIDADRIRGEYLRKGFLDIDVRPRVERKDELATVIYTVEEGERAKTQVAISGLPSDVPASDVRAKLPLADNAPFDYEPYDLAKPLLLGVVQDKGYARAKLDASVIADRTTRTATVDLSYTPGPKCKFGNVEIAGATGELAEAVQDRLALAPGQVYSTQAITQTQRNLYGFGRFSTVQVQPDQGTGDTVGVKVSVTEGARRTVQLGGGFGLDPHGYEVRGRAGYSIAGWPFPLDTASLELRPAYAYVDPPGSYEPRIRALARLERADLFWTYTKAQIDAGYNYLAVEAYTSYGPLARLGFETPVGTDKLKLRVGWSIERLDFRNISQLIDPPARAMDDQSSAIRAAMLETRLGLDKTAVIGQYLQALVVDLRDNPLETRLGAYGELRASEGTPLAGGAFTYVKLVSDVRGYVPLIAGAVLAGRARYGGIFAGGDTIPVTERLFSGGATSQRGFGERRLAPHVTGKLYDAGDAMTPPKPTGSNVTIPYGGGGLAEASLEARVPITTIKSMPLGFVTFLDGGDVSEAPGDLDLGNLHWAVGGGLRLMTVVGPVRLDVGYRLNRKTSSDPEPGSSFAYHLTIGEAF